MTKSEGPLELGNPDFSGGVDYREVEFGSAGDAIRAFRLAEASWNSRGDSEQADRYYLLRMRARHETLPRLVAWMETLLVDWTSGYGTNWTRVLIAWLCTIGGSSLVFFLGKGIEDSSCGNPVRSLGLSIYFSIITFTTLGYGDYRPRGRYKALACLVSILGAYMMALFVYVFARAFMA